MPSTKGITESLMDYGVGFAGGLVYAVSQAFLGSGFWGGIVGAMLAGSVIKGTRGTVISTLLGFQTVTGMGSAQQASGADTSDSVM
jgi:fructose-specific phosphotransferase system IIC component